MQNIHDCATAIRAMGITPTCVKSSLIPGASKLGFPQGTLPPTPWTF